MFKSFKIMSLIMLGLLSTNSFANELKLKPGTYKNTQGCLVKVEELKDDNNSFLINAFAGSEGRGSFLFFLNLDKNQSKEFALCTEPEFNYPVSIIETKTSLGSTISMSCGGFLKAMTAKMQMSIDVPEFSIQSR